jgi:hypothetical protein
MLERGPSLAMISAAPSRAGAPILDSHLQAMNAMGAVMRFVFGAVTDSTDDPTRMVIKSPTWAGRLSVCRPIFALRPELRRSETCQCTVLMEHGWPCGAHRAASRRAITYTCGGMCRM